MRENAFYRIIKILFFMKGNTGLGPNAIRCAGCGEVINTGNVEWADMKTGPKIYLWILTVLYSLLLGFMMAIPILSFVGKVMEVTDRNYPSTLLWISVAIFFALPLVFLQYVRIELSLRRTEMNSNEPFIASFFNWQTNFQSLGRHMD